MTISEAKVDAQSRAIVTTTNVKLVGNAAFPLGTNLATVEIVGNMVKITGATEIELVSNGSSSKLDAAGPTVQGH